ncbi:MAG: hypothetical protein ACTHV8_11450 [Nesterenkonia sp.]
MIIAASWARPTTLSCTPVGEGLWSRLHICTVLRIHHGEQFSPKRVGIRDSGEIQADGDSRRRLSQPNSEVLRRAVDEQVG